MAAGSVGESFLRAENIERIIKQIATTEFVIKQVFSQPTSSSWDETYYRETTANLTAARPVARGAAFPHAVVEWEKHTATMQKGALEAELLYEDAISNNIDVLQRTMIRLGKDVSRVIDTACWNVLAEVVGTTPTPVQINNITIPASEVWDNPISRGSRLPHEHIARAISAIADDGYKADTIIISESDKPYVLTNDIIMDSFDASSPRIMENGNIGKILGLNILVSNNITADYALVCESKTCATYRVLTPLTVETIRDAGIKTIVRTWEIGVPFLTDPKAICLITNTRN